VLVRHAQAATAPPVGGRDADRPLIAKGHDQARRLARALEAWELRPARVLSSPWLRAAATAEALRGDPPAPVAYLDALAAGDPGAASAAIAAALGPGERTAVVVGHEPWLGELASWWLTGDADGLQVAYRKAAAMVLVGGLGPGAMTLTAFVPMRMVKALQDE
jgi:phosphohistidine phosphatase